jgi:hypothetical protein
LKTVNRGFEARHNEVLRILSLLTKEAERLDKDLIFLGGSAVQAVLSNPKRLSIDLDAYFSGDAGKLITVLESSGYRNTARNSFNPGIFEFHTTRKSDVMVKMDFLKIRVLDQYAFKKEIVGPQNIRFTAQVAKPEYLMASKLSALAIGTIGRKKDSETLETDVVKDVYDFNSICDEFPGLSTKTGEALREIITLQNQLRKTKYTVREVFDSLEKTLKAIARFGEGTLVTQGALKNFGEYLFGETELTRSGLAMMAMRVLYRATAMQRGEDPGKGEEAAEKEADRAYVSKCEKALAEAGEDIVMLHELKIFTPRALIYLYSSKFPG